MVLRVTERHHQDIAEVVELTSRKRLGCVESLISTTNACTIVCGLRVRALVVFFRILQLVML